MKLLRKKAPAFVLLMGLGLTLSGCQTIPQVAESVQAQDRKLQALTDFHFSGGLGIWTDAESISARIRWEQSKGDLDLNLTGPMGMGEFKLQDKAGEVTLTRGKTVMTRGTSPDDVIQRGLGLLAPVPVEELKQWVRGLAGSGTAIVRDSADLLSSLQYVDGTGVKWSVRFKRYQTVEDLSLPALITASGGDYSVRLLLKNWELTTNISQSDHNEFNKRLSIVGR